MNLVYMLTNRTYSVTRGILMVILGILLLIWPSMLTRLIVQIIAAFSIGIGLIMLVMFLKNMSKRNAEDSESANMNLLNILNVLLYLILGTLIFMYPDFFIGILMFFFGAILIIFGVIQLLNLIFSGKYASISPFYYVVAIIVTLSGIFLFFKPFDSQKVITMFFGGVLLLSGLSDLFAVARLKNVKFNRQGNIIDNSRIDNSRNIEIDPEK